METDLDMTDKHFPLQAHHEEVAEAVVEEHPAVAEEAIVVDGAVADPASKEERESSLYVSILPGDKTKVLTALRRNLTDTPAYSLHGAAKKTSW